MAWMDIAQLGISGMGLFNSIFGNKNTAQQQYEYNLALQREQQNWLEKMSSTAHQREKEDLLAAGFNPLLALNNGASTPNGGLNSLGSDLSSAQNMERQNKINAILGFANLAQNQQSVNSASNLQNAQAQNQLADAGLKTVQTIQNKLETLFRKKDLDNYEKRFAIELEKGMTDILRGQVSSAREANAIQLDNYNSKSNRINANANNMKAVAYKNLASATEKYTNERSRGYGIPELIDKTIEGIWNRRGLNKFIKYERTF